MKKIIYAICLLQTGAIVYLLNIMIDHPYSHTNMSAAFLQGCKLAAFYSNDENLFNKCSTYAAIYGETLKRLEDQDEGQ